MSLTGFLAGTVTGAALAALLLTGGASVPDQPVEVAPPVTDTRTAVIHVEEDGSYPAGCVPGAYCDDTTRD